MKVCDHLFNPNVSGTALRPGCLVLNKTRMALVFRMGLGASDDSSEPCLC